MILVVASVQSSLHKVCPISNMIDWIDMQVKLIHLVLAGFSSPLVCEIELLSQVKLGMVASNHKVVINWGVFNFLFNRLISLFWFSCYWLHFGFLVSRLWAFMKNAFKFLFKLKQKETRTSLVPCTRVHMIVE